MDKINDIIDNRINETLQSKMAQILMADDNQIVPRHTHNAVDAPLLSSSSVTGITGDLLGAPVSVLTITNGTNAVVGIGTTITINQSSAVSNGYLSSTDWNTFNNKPSLASFSALPPLSYNNTTGVFTTLMATNKLIGRGTGGSGVMEEITLGTGLSLTGTTLNSTGGTVTNVSVSTLNGFAGTVASPTTTPVITISTTITTPVLAANGSSLTVATVTGNGSLVVLNDSPTFVNSIDVSNANIVTDTGTGTKIATAANQKIGFWNTPPIIQPTTGGAAAAFLANTSGIVDDSATFDGYSLGQVVKALRNAGLLA